MQNPNDPPAPSAGAVASRRGNLLSGAILIGAVLGAYVLASMSWPVVSHRVFGTHSLFGHSNSVSTTTDPTAKPRNPYASAHGQNLVAYFFTASDCGWSQALDNHKVIRSFRSDLRSVHGAKHAQITVVAVDLDRDVEKGMAFLTAIGNGSIAGAFDQVMVGGSWLNDQVMRLAWRDGTIRPALPQILVVERQVSSESYLSTYKIGVGADRVVATAVGQLGITSWVQQGYPLDDAPHGPSTQ